MNRSLFNRIAWLQAITMLVLALPVAGAGMYVWRAHHLSQQRLADLEPRYARLAGLLERKAELEVMGTQANQQLARLAYPVTLDVTQAGNDAQQRIRTLFADSKLDIISIQVLTPVKEASNFDRIPINLRVEGDLAGLQNALALLSNQSPLVLVDTLTVQTIGAVKPSSIQRLGAQFNFFVLRVRS